MIFRPVNRNTRHQGCLLQLACLCRLSEELCKVYRESLWVHGGPRISTFDCAETGNCTGSCAQNSTLPARKYSHHPPTLHLSFLDLGLMLHLGSLHCILPDLCPKATADSLQPTCGLLNSSSYRKQLLCLWQLATRKRAKDQYMHLQGLTPK